ncbi:hypothetical protein BU16DRAFT_498974 [Lophium mytilinum]|uniref:Aromatic-L-amino-acid decarboxylase n=1 Tax=Lophium mytilinum TaxID=390894 RepID=A0A6A6RF24_9PEZI|nr:hypothetical protein BU16DRAFT_498974 [Lophium mytilinum]
MNSSQFREASHAAIEEIIQYYDTLASRPVLSTVSPGYLRPLLPNGPPQTGESWPAIQSDIERVIMPGLTHWQSPNFMAFFPASSTFPSMLGEMYSAAFTAPAFNWLCSPAVTELETVVLDWLAGLFALPECFLSKGEGGGVIQGSASEAVVTVMVAARERIVQRRCGHLEEGEEKEQKMGEERIKLVALGGEHSHSSVQKAANIAGVRFRSVPAPKSSGFRVTAQSLRQKIEECKSKGIEPFFMGLTLGTTNTCAVDEFEEIVAVAKDYPDVWIHVDAAYAGAALALPEYQHLAAPFAAFDSFNTNMHKWLLTNFDASVLWVKQRRSLTDALSITPSYLRNEFSDSGLVTDYRDWQIPLGRRFRALKIWFVLRTYGVDGIQAHLRNTIKLGELFHSLVVSRPDLFTVVAGPAFALTVLTVNPEKRGAAKGARVTPASSPDPNHEAYLNDFTSDAESQYLANANTVTKEVYERINSGGEFFLTSTTMEGIFTIRVVSANPMAEEKYLRRVFEVLVETAEGVLTEREKGK